VKSQHVSYANIQILAYMYTIKHVTSRGKLQAMAFACKGVVLIGTQQSNEGYISLSPAGIRHQHYRFSLTTGKMT
jgi:hypothetical protein